MFLWKKKLLLLGFSGGLLLAVLALGWQLRLVNSRLVRQQQQVQALKSALLDKSKQEMLALQKHCSAAAIVFLQNRGWKTTDESHSYTNHFNSKLNKCFVLISGYLPKDDFRTIDLYDAVEGKHYAMYNGHDICDPVQIVILGDRRRCMLDAGVIWYDGNDTKNPPDYHIGFQGITVGPGVGDDNTQKQFLEHIQPFMTE
jgi:hypothetical protein